MKPMQTFNNNGTESTMNNVLPLDKEKIRKKKQNIKLLFCLLTSNLLIFLILNPVVNKSNDPAKLQPITPVDHKHHSKIKLPIKVLMPTNKQRTEYPVTLYNENKRIIVTKAFLHPVKARDKRAGFDNFKIDAMEYREEVIEVPTGDLQKVMNSRSTFFLAYPYQQSIKHTNHPRRKTYEIVF